MVAGHPGPHRQAIQSDDAMNAKDSTGDFVIRPTEPSAPGRKSREQLFSELQVLEAQYEASKEARRELQAAQEALRDSEERYRSLYNDTPVMMHSINAEGELVSVNHYWLEVLGYTWEQVRGHKSWQFVTETSRRWVEEVGLPRLREKGEVREAELQFVKRNGAVIDVLLTAIAQRDDLGRIDHVLAYILDITDRKKAEAALRASEERHRKFFEHSNDALFVLDPEHNTILDVNPRTCELLGYTREELLELPMSAVHPHEMPEFEAFVRRVLNEGSGRTDALTCLTKAKMTIAAEISASAVEIDGAGRIVAWVRDISERKHAESALRESEERFRRLVDRAADSLYVVEDDGRIIDVNRQACEATGYTQGELQRMWVWEIADWLDLEALERSMEQMARTGPVTMGGNHTRKDGTQFPVEVRACLVEERGRQRVLALARDLTERIKAEEVRHKLSLEKVYLQEEIDREHNVGEIVGSAKSIKKLFRDIERVAGTDSTVLISGETGTGKELVARAIHAESGRHDSVLVKVNCAALSPGLIESELFGHEKGAFTGAVARREGRFELADGGSVFLDEIGDLPGELQVKLLRVLQDGEFERVGGTRTLKVDVRVIAATNRDLERAVEEGRFRSDLYYRLKVYPIHVPALRDRKEDIPQLVNYFARKYGSKLGKRLESVPQGALDALIDYPWPGNVRELENVIERAAIVSRDAELELGDWAGQAVVVGESEDLLPLDEVQRRHILKVLGHTGWRVSGPRGAARVLGMKPTTLQARMTKLGIERNAGS
jgi:PAS domain S-box-containing protein